MKLLLFVLLFGYAAACNIAFPNGTDVAWHWWQCDSGPIKVYNTTPWDQTGNNYEYPIHLGAPIMVKVDLDNPSYTFTDPNLRNTVNLWEWGGVLGCSWSSLPTLGLLKDLDACTNGVPCPIVPGRQYMNVIIDFTKYQAIINMLKNDAPYQLQYLLNDKQSGVGMCIMVQARSELK